jgi:hypothetical protein
MDTPNQQGAAAGVVHVTRGGEQVRQVVRVIRGEVMTSSQSPWGPAPLTWLTGETVVGEEPHVGSDTVRPRGTAHRAGGLAPVITMFGGDHDELIRRPAGRGG